MSDDSIMSSPERSGTTIHRVLAHRKSKRKRLECSSSWKEHESEMTVAGDVERSIQSNPKTDIVYRRNADRFAQERLAMEADFADRTQRLSKPKATIPLALALTQSFQTCEQLLTDSYVEDMSVLEESFKTSTDNSPSTPKIDERALRASLKAETESNDPTESEIFRICAEHDEIEEETGLKGLEPCQSKALLNSDDIPRTEYFANESMFFEEFAKSSTESEDGPKAYLDQNSAPSVGFQETSQQQQNKTPTRNSTSVVDEILADFFSSPSSSKSANLSPPLDATPYFRFRRRRNLRTYADRPRRPRRRSGSACLDVPQEHDCVTIASSDSEDALSSVSDLSNQEVASAGVLGNNADDKDEVVTDNLNNSQRVYENLMNLSSFFTQTVNPPRRLSSADSTDNDSVGLSSYEDKQEHTLKRRYSNSLISEGSSTLEDLKGFPQEESDENLDVRDDDNSSSLEREEVNTQIEVKKDFPGDEPPCNDVKKDGEAFQKVDTAENQGTIKESSPADVGYCDAAWFATEDFFDIKLDAKSGLVEEQCEKSQSTQLVGFQTASNKTIKISEEATKAAANLLQDLPDLPTETEKKPAILAVDGSRSASANLQTRCTGFETASKNPIQITDEALSNAAMFFQNLPDLPFHDKEKISGKNASRGFSNTVSKAKPNQELNGKYKPRPTIEENSTFNNFMGFKTASAKRINISDESKEKALSLLASLPEIPDKELNSRKSPEKMTGADCDNNNKEDLTGVHGYDENPLSSEKTSQMSNKRKLAQVNIGEEKSPNHKIVCRTRHFQEDIENDQTPSLNAKYPAKDHSQIHTTPLSAYASQAQSKGLVRQFSLSLTRRRKGRRSTDLQDSQVLNEPIKNDVNKQGASIPTESTDKRATNNNHLFLDTPNSKDFFRKMPSTSTPHQKANGSVSESTATTFKPTPRCTDSSMEAGFTRIQWDNEHEVTKGNETSKSFKIANDSELRALETSKPPPPSPQERVERLCQYEPAPALSPIIMRSNVARAVGLSRQRRHSVKLRSTSKS